MGTHGEMHLSVHYPIFFRMLLLVALSMSLWWILHFFVSVMPIINEASDDDCRFSDDELRQTTIVLAAYFVCFAVVRAFVFMPGVAARVAEIQSGSHGRCWFYNLHVLLHGPLYTFGIGTMLFGFQLMMSPTCEGSQLTVRDVILRRHATHSCLVFASCSILAYAHGKIISMAAARQAEEQSQRAPPGTLDKFQAYTYDPELFGADDQTKYAGECPICLQEWEEDDQIKVTPCGHAFHGDCIGHWLKNERTCAFCRQDVTATPFPSRTVIGVPSVSS